MTKNNSTNKLGKFLTIILLSIGFTVFASCSETSDGTMSDQWANLVNETSHEVQLNGNTLIYGDHTYTVNGEIELNGTVFNTHTAYVTFTNVPSGYTEFEAVYNNLLGKSIQGTAAMIPMAFEIYARDNATGERCLNLLAVQRLGHSQRNRPHLKDEIHSFRICPRKRPVHTALPACCTAERRP